MESNPDLADKPGRAPLLQAALASMPYGFSIWDEAQRLILYNRRYLEMYNFPQASVRVGMTLREMSQLTFEVGNHPGFSPEELYAGFSQRLRATEDSKKILRGQKP